MYGARPLGEARARPPLHCTRGRTPDPLLHHDRRRQHRLLHHGRRRDAAPHVDGRVEQRPIFGVLPCPSTIATGEGIGRGLRVVRYDNRGTGMSDRSALDFSLEARIRDIDAVVAKLGLTTFAVAANSYGCLAAVEYAARNPERVSKLVLSLPVTNGAADATTRSPVGLPCATWRTRSGRTTRTRWRRRTSDTIGRNLSSCMAQRMREAMSPAAVQAIFEALGAIDVTPSLRMLTMPTLSCSGVASRCAH